MLGHALQSQGKLADALAAYRRAAELAQPGSSGTTEVLGHIQQVEQEIRLEGRLLAVLEGKDKPASAADRVAIAQVCYDKALHAAAARFLGEAFQADGKLAEDMKAGNRYNAACSAALAGCGNSKDAPPPDQEANPCLG